MREGKKTTEGSRQKKEGQEGDPKSKGAIARKGGGQQPERGPREKEIEGKGRDGEQALKMALDSALVTWKKPLPRSQTPVLACAAEM